MKPTYMAGLLLLTVAGLLGGSAIISPKAVTPVGAGGSGDPSGAAPLAPPYPNVTIPGIPPAGNCCLWQLEKRIDGKREANFGNPYQCDKGPTARGNMKIEVKLTTAGAFFQNTEIITDGRVMIAHDAFI